MTDRPASRGPLGVLLDLLSSLGFAALLLTILLFLTWQGTLAQAHVGLYEAQRRFFDSFLFDFEVLGVSLPFPGAQLVLWLLAVNLVLGGLVRMRKSNATFGVLIVHLGIALLLVAGFVKYYHSNEGVVVLFEGDQASQFRSDRDWELVIAERLGGGRAREYVVPQARLTVETADREVVLWSAALPFEVAVREYQVNCEPRPEGPAPASSAVVDGVFLQELKPRTEVAQNAPGALLEIRLQGTAKPLHALVWSYQKVPLAIEVAGRRFAFSLRKRVFPMGWTIRLDEFTKKDHPGMRMAADYRSRVAVIDGAVERSVEISMNEPLRYRDLILYQASYGPQDAVAGQPLYTVLAASSNPSDQWPEYSCWVIAVGLCLHYLRRFLGYAVSVRSGRTAA